MAVYILRNIFWTVIILIRCFQQEPVLRTKVKARSFQEIYFEQQGKSEIVIIKINTLGLVDRGALKRINKFGLNTEIWRGDKLCCQAGMVSDFWLKAGVQLAKRTKIQSGFSAPFNLLGNSRNLVNKDNRYQKKQELFHIHHF